MFFKITSCSIYRLQKKTQLRTNLTHQISLQWSYTVYDTQHTVCQLCLSTFLHAWDFYSGGAMIFEDKSIISEDVRRLSRKFRKFPMTFRTFPGTSPKIVSPNNLLVTFVLFWQTERRYKNFWVFYSFNGLSLHQVPYLFYQSCPQPSNLKFQDVGLQKKARKHRSCRQAHHHHETTISCCHLQTK